MSSSLDKRPLPHTFLEMGDGSNCACESYHTDIRLENRLLNSTKI